MPVERRRVGGDLVIGTVLYKAIGGIAHFAFGIADQRFALFVLCKTRKHVDLAAEQLLVKIGVVAVNVFISPAGVFGELAVVFVGVACFYRAFLRALLKDLVFVIAHFDGHAVVVLRSGGDR